MRVLFFLLFPMIVLSQHFSVHIASVEGDLNKDGLNDLVTIKLDTISSQAPYLLEVFFKKNDGTYKKIVKTNKAFIPKFPNGRNGILDGRSAPEILIKKGILILNVELLRGYYEHKFRFQNQNFELIGYTHVGSDQFEFTKLDFNLSTGVQYYTREPRYEEKISKIKKIIKINPLPTLQEFVPLSTDFY